MLELTTMHLTNYLLWEDVEFTFEEGITHVYGKNRSGKSLLFSPLSPMLYDTAPIPKNARATLSANVGKHEIDLSVFNNAKARNRFELVVDGRAQNTETIDASKTLISKFITNNLQQSIFDTTVNISGLGKHPLAEGKPSTRLDWVHETLAYASQLDAYEEMVESKLKEVKEDSIKFKLVDAEYNELEVVEKPIETAEELSKKLDNAANIIKSLEKKVRFIEQALDTPEKMDKPKFSVEECEERLQAVNKEVRQHERNKEAVKEYKQHVKRFGKLEKRKEKRKNQYIALCEESGRKAISPKKAIKKLRDKNEILSTKLHNAKANNELYEEQAEIRKLAKGHAQWGNKEAYTSRLKDLRDRIAVNTKIIESHKSGKQHCEMCGSNLRASKEHIAKVQEDLEKYTKRYDTLEHEYEVYKARNTRLVKLVDVGHLKEEIDFNKRLIVSAEEYLEVANNVVETPPKVDYSKEEHKKAVSKQKNLENHLLDAKTYEKLSNKISKVDEDNPFIGKPKEKLEKSLRKTSSELSKTRREQRDLNDRMINARTQTILYSKYKENKKKLHATRKTLYRASKDHAILQVLRKALGRDGFRTKRLESTLELFVDNLNSLAPLIWDEPFKFDIETGPRKCNLVIHRNKVAGDAFTTSGSENRNLQLLAALAMLRLLPDNRRCDTIILDELEANMDAPSRHRMMRDFLQEVQKTVPKVIVVSPLTRQELGLTPDHAYIVTKKNAKSRLAHQ